MIMGKCPNCGNKGWFLRTEICISCSKKGCDKCFTPLFEFREDAHFSPFTTWWICSSNCRETVKKELMSRIPPNAINLARYPSAHPHPEFKPSPSDILYRDALISIIRGTDEILARKINRISWEVLYQDNLYKEFKQHCDLTQAENLERAGRREEAARIYERYLMYDRARKLREIRVGKNRLLLEEPIFLWTSTHC